ncbi:MAG: hypothetical protein Q8O07_05290 [Chloroflexota bacterium]|nr:hypothetical protein [Chloroflexota bacterium]
MPGKTDDMMSAAIRKAAGREAPVEADQQTPADQRTPAIPTAHAGAGTEAQPLQRVSMDTLIRMAARGGL